jgi:hypothetical protein
MRAVVLYRNDVDWRQEEDVVRKYFSCIDSRMLIQKDDLVIPRFSALPFYQEQEKDFSYAGAKMINSYEQHRYIADLGTWYWDLADFTPKTWKNLHEIPDEGPFILKGETNSKKFLWKTHMFAQNKQEAIDVHSRLMSDSMLQYQNIYIRQYVELERLADGLQNLPITREYRFFIYKKSILSGGFYWSSHVDEIREAGIHIDPNEVPRDFLKKIISRVQNTKLTDPPVYYVIDVAKTANGDWILIELNDGTMSGLSDNNPDVLYKNLKKKLQKEGY